MSAAAGALRRLTHDAPRLARGIHTGKPAFGGHVRSITCAFTCCTSQKGEALLSYSAPRMGMSVWATYLLAAWRFDSGILHQLDP